MTAHAPWRSPALMRAFRAFARRQLPPRRFLTGRDLTDHLRRDIGLPPHA